MTVPSRAGRSPLGVRLRVAGGVASWTFATLIVATIVGLAASDSRYAGASDDRVAAIALDTYAAFLRRVLGAIVLVTFAEAVVLFVAAYGLVLLALARRPSLAQRRLSLHPVCAGVALLVCSAFWGFAAQAHPGLFLGTLANSRVIALWAEACRYIAPALAVASLAGYGAAVTRASVRARIACGVVGGLVIVGAWRSTMWVRAFTAPTFGIHHREDPATLPALSATAEGVSEESAEKEKEKEKEKKKKAGKTTPRPNILWIAVDSLRPDKIDPENTPNLAALVSQSIYFPNTLTPVPRTGPSWAAALTSLDPITTGIETMFPDEARANLANVALPAHLASEGYRTMVVSEYAGEFFRRVKLGFEIEAVPRAELMQISGQIMLSRAPFAFAGAGLAYAASPALRHLLPGPMNELIRGLPNFSVPAILGEDVHAALRDTSKPAFILAFYSQPHFPYTSSPEFAKRYRVSGASKSLAYGRDVTSESPITTDADRKQVEGLYRGALAETDFAVGKLLSELEASHWLDDTIVVLTADHGEGLYECNDCVGHGDNLRGMMTLKVPLAFRLPKNRFPDATAHVSNTWVSLFDVYPTLLSLLGLPPIRVHEGTALIDDHGRATTPSPRVHVIETGEWLWTTAAVPKDRIDYPPITELAHLSGDRIMIDPKYEGLIRAAKHRAAIRAPYKLVYEPSRAGVRWRLFDFESDPLDLHDLAASKPEVLEELRAAVRKSVLRHSRVVPVDDFFLTRPPNPPEDQW